MTVGKGETAAAIMVGARRIEPERRFHTDGESGVVQSVNVLIHQNPKHRGTRFADRGETFRR